MASLLRIDGSFFFEVAISSYTSNCDRENKIKER
jgi:hypothetical protein